MAGKVIWKPEQANNQIRAWAIRALTAAAIVIQNRAKELVSVPGTGTREPRKPGHTVTVRGKGGKPKSYFLNVEGKQVRVSYKAGKTYYFNVGGKAVRKTKYTAQYHVDTGTGWVKIRRPKRYYRRGPSGAPEVHYGF